MANKVRGDYHVHTTMSDGVNTPEQVVSMAILLGLDEIGICDHYLTEKGGINCVDDGAIGGYLKRIEGLQQTFGDRIRVLAGLEIDTSVNNPRRFRLPFEKLNGLDFVIFEYVEDNKIRSIHKYQDVQAVFTLDDVVEARAKLTCHVGLAHPDILRNFSSYDPEELAMVLKENGIYIDASFNNKHGRPDVCEEFGDVWEFTPFCVGLGAYEEAFKKVGVEFAPSTDHHLDDVDDHMSNISKAEQMIEGGGFRLKRFLERVRVYEPGDALSLGGLPDYIESLSNRVSGILDGGAICERDHSEIIGHLKAIGTRIFNYSRAAEQCGYMGEHYSRIMQSVKAAKTSITYAVSSVNLASSGFAQSPLMKEADKTTSIKKELVKLRDYVDEIVRNPLYSPILISQSQSRG